MAEALSEQGGEEGGEEGTQKCDPAACPTAAAAAAAAAAGAAVAAATAGLRAASSMMMAHVTTTPFVWCIRWLCALLCYIWWAGWRLGGFGRWPFSSGSGSARPGGLVVPPQRGSAFEMRSADLSIGFGGQRECNTAGTAPLSTGLVGGRGRGGPAAALGAVWVLVWPLTGAREHPRAPPDKELFSLGDMGTCVTENPWRGSVR